MGLRADWVAAKAAAKRLNNNTEVKFPAKLDLGPALDKLATAEKAYEKAHGEYDLAWAKATDAWVAAGAKVSAISARYVLALDDVNATEAAKKHLRNFLTMKLIGDTAKIRLKGEQLEARLAETRKKKKA